MPRRSKNLGLVIAERWGPDPKLVPDFGLRRSSPAILVRETCVRAPVWLSCLLATAAGAGIVWFLESTDLPLEREVEEKRIALVDGEGLSGH